MAGNIFLLQSDATLVKMSEGKYESEALLQELLANYPDLMAGEQINTEEPRKWLLVSREMGVPDIEDGGGRWSLDHLFLDQDAIPTLVEVKRSSDTRIRREVVGQMLDYAANAVVYWPIEIVRARFESTCEKSGRDPEVLLSEFLGESLATDSFWQNVKTNLQAGRIRLVFVADVIPHELQRVVEFLNDQMDPAEVLAIEIKQYLGEGNLKTLVPRIVGQTALAQKKKESGVAEKPEKIDEQAYIDEMIRERGTEEAQVAKRIREWAASEKLRFVFDQRANSVSFKPEVILPGNRRLQIVSVNSYGTATTGMRWFCKIAPFDKAEKRTELQSKFNGIPETSITDANMVGYVTVKLKPLTEQKGLDEYLAVLTWMLHELRGASD